MFKKSNSTQSGASQSFGVSSKANPNMRIGSGIGRGVHMMKATSTRQAEGTPTNIANQASSQSLSQME